MRKLAFGLLGFGILLAAIGCGVSVPPKLEVRDTGSGRMYTTYQPWGKVIRGTGYEFTDIDTGKRITLTNYEISTLEGKKSVPDDSADAASFKEAKARGGVK